MKKLATLASIALLAAGSAFAQAQSIRIDVPDTVLVTTPTPRDAPSIHASITNISSDPIRVIARRTIEALPAGQNTYFCFSIDCYAPTANESSDTLTLAPNQTDNSFKAYIDPAGYEGVAYVHYDFVDLTHGTSSRIRFTFISTLTAVKESEARAQLISGALPAIGTLRLNAAPGVSVSLLSATGQTVRQARLTNTQTELNLTGLTPGLYILSTADGRRVRIPVQ